MSESTETEKKNEENKEEQKHTAEKEIPAIPTDPKEAAKLLAALRKAKKFGGLLGIAQKAGKVVAGTALVTDGIRSGSPAKCPCVVFLASDVSDNTKKRIENCCTYYEIPMHPVRSTTAELGAFIGKSGSISAVGITDRGLADALTNLI